MKTRLLILLAALAALQLGTATAASHDLRIHGDKKVRQHRAPRPTHHHHLRIVLKNTKPTPSADDPGAAIHLDVNYADPLADAAFGSAPTAPAYASGDDGAVTDDMVSADDEGSGASDVNGDDNGTTDPNVTSDPHNPGDANGTSDGNNNPDIVDPNGDATDTDGADDTDDTVDVGAGTPEPITNSLPPVSTLPPVDPVATAASPPPTTTAEPTPLPVFFFHGVTANSNSGFNFNANLTAEGRAFVALSFCQDACSVTSLNVQVPLAIQQIRATVASDPRFADGYIFIGHSQGASIARAVVEEMDDHQVHTLISLAGPQNGIFYGPQPSDAVPTQAFATRIGPRTIPAAVFNFSEYSPADYALGKFQADFNTLVLTNPVLQAQLSVLNLGRSPVTKPWRATNTFLPVVNNINPCDDKADVSAQAACEANKKRRRANFLKLQSAHFFGSPADDVIAPWQSSLLGQYTDVATQDDLLRNFALLEPVGMKLTDEYVQDTYGLKSLDARGALFLYDVPDVGHSCWVADSTPLGRSDACLWRPVYENYVYPLLHQHGWGVVESRKA